MFNFIYFMLLYPSEFFMFTLLIFVVNWFVAFYMFDNKVKVVILSIIATFFTISIITWLKYDKILSSAEIKTWTDIIKERWGYLDMDELKYYDENNNWKFLEYYSDIILIPDFMLNDLEKDILLQEEINKIKQKEADKKEEIKMIKEMQSQKERRDILDKYK